MQELINMITEKTGISAEQASHAIDIIKNFVKEKFPMLSGAVDNMFASSGSQDATQPASSGAGDILDSVKDKLGGMFGG